MYKRILVPIDGSDSAKAGLREAIKLAKNVNAKLRLLHVIDETAMIQYAEAPIYTTDMMRILEDQGRKVLATALAETQRAGIEANTILDKKMGAVADAIVDQARAWPAQIIVLGTHGRRGIARLMMGSDAESVVRTSPVPVLLVNTHAAKTSRKSSRRALRLVSS
jgi:nucleotide-binding universal stress UspA family protein